MMCAACVGKMLLFLLLIFVFKSFSRKPKMGRENVCLPHGYQEVQVKNLPAARETRET